MKAALRTKKRSLCGASGGFKWSRRLPLYERTRPNCASPGGPRMPPDQDDDSAPELPWVERRPIARLAAFGEKTDKPVITAKALREQKAVIIGKPEWPKEPTEQQKKYMGNIAKDFSVEWNPRQTAAARAVDKVFQNDASYEETDAAVGELMLSLVEQEKR